MCKQELEETERCGDNGRGAILGSKAFYYNTVTVLLLVRPVSATIHMWMYNHIVCRLLMRGPVLSNVS